MSRIREALKQAEEERIGENSGNLIRPPVDPSVRTALDERNGVADRAPDIFGEAMIISPTRRDTGAFKELQAKCAHPVWQPSGEWNVFVRADSTPAAEQF